MRRPARMAGRVILLDGRCRAPGCRRRQGAIGCKTEPEGNRFPVPATFDGGSGMRDRRKAAGPLCHQGGSCGLVVQHLAPRSRRRCRPPREIAARGIGSVARSMSMRGCRGTGGGGSLYEPLRGPRWSSVPSVLKTCGKTDPARPHAWAHSRHPPGDLSADRGRVLRGGSFPTGRQCRWKRISAAVVPSLMGQHQGRRVYRAQGWRGGCAQDPTIPVFLRKTGI